MINFTKPVHEKNFSLKVRVLAADLAGPYPIAAQVNDGEVVRFCSTGRSLGGSYQLENSPVDVIQYRYFDENGNMNIHGQWKPKPGHINIKSTLRDGKIIAAEIINVPD